MKIPPLVLIRWRDSASYCGGGWPKIDEMVDGMHATEIESVGFLLHRDRKRILYAHSLDVDNGRANGVGVIPANAVVKITTLSRKP